MKLKFAGIGISLLLIIPALSAWENGFLFYNEFLSENFTSGASGRTNEIFESGKFSAWFSFRPAEKTALYLKASFNFFNDAVLDDPKGWEFAFEPDIVQLSIAPAGFFYAELGRFYYHDILTMVADGPFDGACITFYKERHSFSMSAFYTGLLYKETAKIMLTGKERLEYYHDGYFAPPHILISAVYQYIRPSGSIFALNMLSQMDTRHDSQNQTTYAIGKLSLALSDQYCLFGGAVFSWLSEEDKTSYALSSTLGFIIYAGTVVPSQFTVETKLFYGNFDDDIPMPVITQKKIGQIYQPMLKRLAAAKAEYVVRLNNTLNFNMSLGVFARLNTDTMPEYWLYSEFEVEDSRGFLLGEELSVGAVWTPASDFSLKLDVIFFVPDSTPGGIYKSGAPVKYDIRLGMLLSF